MEWNANGTLQSTALDHTLTWTLTPFCISLTTVLAARHWPNSKKPMLAQRCHEALAQWWWAGTGDCEQNDAGLMLPTNSGPVDLLTAVCNPRFNLIFLRVSITVRPMLMPKAVLSVCLSVKLWAMHIRLKISKYILHRIIEWFNNLELSSTQMCVLERGTPGKTKNLTSNPQ